MLGQPAAAFPAAPRRGRAGLLAVPVLVVAITVVLGAVLAGTTALRLLGSMTGLAVLVAFQALLYRRQHALAGDLQRSQSSFRTLVKSSLDPVVILDDRLRVTYASQAVADLLGVDPAECVMVDDLAGNIRGAVAAGMVGVLHKSYEETAEELEILFDRKLR